MIRILLVVCTLVLLLVLFFSYRKASDPVKIAPEESFMEGVNMIHVRSNKLDWSANASKVSFHRNDSRSSITDIFFRSDTNELSASSDTGTYDLSSDELILNRNVRARKEDMTIFTENVKWDPAMSSLSTDEPVEIKGSHFTLKGMGLLIDENGDLTISSDVRAFIEQ
ncbi:MAG: LPS export ABC transporter periplasmic protein LptC [Nitrospirota bacterium]|nr:MAG: LPS export ABC transporter periplasmic protein LptC [Nitrospirota bacterium]